MKYIILILLLLVPILLKSKEPVPIIYFYEADCPDCKHIDKSVIPPILKKYDGKIKLFKFNVDFMKNFEALMAFEVKYGISPQEVPQFYTSYGVTWKPNKIGQELPKLIDNELKSGSNSTGKFSKFIDNFLKTGKTGISVVEAIQKQYGRKNSNSRPHGLNTKIRKKLLICEFRKSGCKNCDRLSLGLKYLKKKFPDRIIIENYNIKDRNAKIRHEAFCIKYEVDDQLHLVTPAVFFGDYALVGEKALDNLDIVSVVAKILAQKDYYPTKKITEKDLEEAEKKISQRFELITWTGVLGAGLLDGVNPCAFITIVFLLSYLSLMKYRRKHIALVGLSFSLAVFLTYLAIGLGFLKFVESIQEIPYLTEIVYYLAISLLMIIGILNLKDYYNIKKGSLKDMNLKLNDSLRQRINSLIREKVKLKHYIIGAFGLGFAISILELACTGQVYLPTLLFIIQTQGFKLKAVLLLIAYNLAFIIPLLIIFTIFWRGSTEKSISQWLTQQGANIKLAIGVLFILLSVLLYFII